MIREIVKVPDPILRRKSKSLKDYKGDIRVLAQDLVDTMIAKGAAGLAAVQINEPYQMIVVDVDRIPLVMCGPIKIFEKRKHELGPEGCLSIPGLIVSINRSTDVSVRFNDLNDQECIVRLVGEPARAVTHEYEHLFGTLIDTYKHQ